MKEKMVINPQKHSYPLKIALRTRRLIQGTLFFGILMDTTIGEYFRIFPNAEGNIKDLLINQAGWREHTYEISWSCFEDYIKEFKNPLFHQSVYSIISHWDWYISNIGKFIFFAEKSAFPEKQGDKDLLKINSKPFSEQINIITHAAGISLNPDDDILDLIEEMHLVRNIGMHNEWEVDDTYLKKTKLKNLKFGEKRVLRIEEITKWHAAILDVVDLLTSEIAIRFSQAPKYG